MVRQLAHLDRANGPLNSRELMHRAVQSGGGDHAKLRYWGLVEQTDEFEWQITEDGKHFLRENLTVPLIAYVFNKKLLGFSEKVCTVRDRLNKRFDYEELLGIIT